MNKWVKDILNIFFPCECHLCGNLLSPDERFICTPCISSLPRTGYHRNIRNPMEERFAGLFPFVAATGHFFYSRESALAQLIQDMKYRNFPSLGNKLGLIAAKELIVSGFLNDIDAVVPVPMHYLKKAKRGYNQTDRIAEGFSEVIGCKTIKALKMTRQRKTQTSLSRRDRLMNAEKLFAVRSNIDLADKGILLVDDICTTGTTLGSAASALSQAFPTMRLYLFSLAVAF